MYWIDEEDGNRYTITGNANKEVVVHSIDGHVIKVTITLGGGAVLNGNMNLIEFIDMMDSNRHGDIYV